MSVVDMSDYRWIRAMKRFRLRQRNANIAFDLTDNYELWNKLRHEAMMDYLNEVPELRALRQKSDKIKILPLSTGDKLWRTSE